VKTVLIVGGAALALLVVWKLASATAAPLVTTGTGTGTSLVPGSSGGGTGSSDPQNNLVRKTFGAGATGSGSDKLKTGASLGLATVVAGPSYFAYKAGSSLIGLL
jgi:hypothetical protein